MSENFKSERLNDHLYRIIDLCGDLFYLIVGEKECTLLDTGIGYDSLKDYIKTITDKPVTNVFITHGHVDHASGSGEFEKVYLNEKDFELVKEHTKKEARLGYIGKEVDESLLVEAKTTYLPLVDGTEFKLDGVTMRVYEISGHTKGSMMFYLVEWDMLLLGDACNSFTFLFLDESSTIHEYLNTLRKYEDFKCGTVLFSHGHNNGTIEIIKEAILTCEEIIQGTINDVEAPKFGVIESMSAIKDIRLSSAIDEHFKSANGRQFNAVYDAKRI